MIFFVVFGHLIEPITNTNEVTKTIYMFIYSFHMPIFIILAGALTKLDISEKRISKTIGTLMVPFLVFTILYEAFNIISTGSISHYTLNWQPYWILWFLFSLFVWKLTLPIILQFKFPLSISIVISLYAGYIGDVGYFLGVSRTLYFFPFFIVGYKLGPALLSNKYLTAIPKSLYFAIICFNAAVFWLFNDWPQQWLYGSMSYEKLSSVEWYSFVIRTMFYSISFISSIAILMIMSNKKSVLSTRGKNSLFVYVWHVFFIKTAVYFGLIKLLSDVSSLFVLFISAMIITFLLSSAFVANLTNKILLAPVQRLLLSKS